VQVIHRIPTARSSEPLNLSLRYEGLEKQEQQTIVTESCRALSSFPARKKLRVFSIYVPPTLSRPYLSNMAQQAPQIATTWRLYRPTRPGMIQNGVSDCPT
jgi:hypothetical protein